MVASTEVVPQYHGCQYINCPQKPWFSVQKLSQNTMVFSKEVVPNYHSCQYKSCLKNSRFRYKLYQNTGSFYRVCLEILVFGTDCPKILVSRTGCLQILISCKIMSKNIDFYHRLSKNFNSGVSQYWFQVSIK